MLCNLIQGVPVFIVLLKFCNSLFTVPYPIAIDKFNSDLPWTFISVPHRTAEYECKTNIDAVFQNLRQVLRTVLKHADINCAQSIAIPPIGTGNLGYPSNLVARTIVMETAAYLQQHPTSALQEIRLVVLESDQDILKAKIIVV